MLVPFRLDAMLGFVVFMEILGLLFLSAKRFISLLLGHLEIRFLFSLGHHLTQRQLGLPEALCDARIRLQHLGSLTDVIDELVWNAGFSTDDRSELADGETRLIRIFPSHILRHIQILLM